MFGALTHRREPWKVPDDLGSPGDYQPLVMRIPKTISLFLTNLTQM